MVSIFKMESLITIPLITTIPIIDIKLMLMPKIFKNKKAPAKSRGISIKIIKGKTRDSNCDAKMKYNRIKEINKTIINSPINS